MVRLEDAPFDPFAALAAFSASTAGAGAVVSFIGSVRGDGAVEALFLDHKPGLTAAAIAAMIADARQRFDLIGAQVVHRVGKVRAGEPVVLVATSARHRRAAFDACDYLMDYLKIDAPFWKQEVRAEGVAWIEPRAADYADRARWTR